jgi:hypothetical protein
MGNMHGGALVFNMATADHHVRRSTSAQRSLVGSAAWLRTLGVTYLQMGMKVEIRCEMLQIGKKTC